MTQTPAPWSHDPPPHARPSSGNTTGHHAGSDWEATSSWWTMPDGTRHLLALHTLRWIHGPWPSDMPKRCITDTKLLGKVARMFQSQGPCPDPTCGGLVGKALRVQGNLASLHAYSAAQRCCRCGKTHHPDPMPNPWSAHTLLRVQETLAMHAIAHTSP